LAHPSRCTCSSTLISQRRVDLIDMTSKSFLCSNPIYPSALKPVLSHITYTPSYPL
jgi:hypothetical protein